MQGTTLEKTVRVCVEKLKLGYIVQAIDLEVLKEDQRPSLLRAVRFYGVNFPNVTIIDDTCVVFHGNGSAANMFLTTLIGEAEHLESDLMRRHACALCFAMNALRGARLIYGGSDQERRVFDDVLRREGTGLDAEFFVNFVSDSKRAYAESWPSWSSN